MKKVRCKEVLEIVKALVLIDEIRKNQKDADELDVNQAYAALLEAADRLKVMNPFRDKDIFFSVFRKTEKLKKNEWVNVIVAEMPIERKDLIAYDVLFVEFYKERLEKNPETVLIAEAEKFIPNLRYIVDSSPDTKFVLTAESQIDKQALACIFEDYNNVEILLTSIYEQDFAKQKFDLVFACPVTVSECLSDNTRVTCKDPDSLIALKSLPRQLTDSGELVIFLQDNISSAIGNTKECREYIQKNYRIKELSKVPSGILGCDYMMLDIKNTKPDDDNIVFRKYSAIVKNFISEDINSELLLEVVKKFYLDDTDTILKFSLEVSDETTSKTSVLEKLGCWNIELIFARQKESYIQYLNTGSPKYVLNQVADIFRGKLVMGKKPSGSIGVVNISNIREYEIDYNQLEHMEEQERKIFKYILRTGDVLLTARGTVLRSAVFHEQAYPCIASSNIIVIRPNDSKVLNSTYLKIFLDSPIGNSLISSIQQDMGVLNISHNDFALLEIPIPDIKTQEQMAEKYNKEYQIYKETVTAAEKRWAEIRNELQKF